MSYKQIKENLLRSGKLFLDDSFPPSSRLLCTDDRNGRVTWKRPAMIVKEGKPRFVVNTVSRFDFDQGALGDCWFVSAAASLVSTNKNSFVKVVPPDQSFDTEYAGIFRFHFWSYGRWREIVIDDYLPCTENGLLYCRNREEPNEFWAALLEKAYAKFYGSYENLKGGFIHYALLDLTGGITEVLEMANYIREPARLHDILQRSYKMMSFIGAAIMTKRSRTAQQEIERENGLFMGHAYSVTGFLTLRFSTGNVRLMRVRNPWGRGEWKGAWSDGWIKRNNLSDEHRQMLRPKTRVDGEFWISVEDFVKNFSQIQMCHVGPDSMTSEVARDMVAEHWHTSAFDGAFVQKKSVTSQDSCCCGSSKNAGKFAVPQYYVRLSSPDEARGCTLVVSLMEKEHRRSTDPDVYINFYIYQLPEARRLRMNSREIRNHRLVGRGSEKFVFYKEVARRFTLLPGFYVIIPKTFREGARADFYLRIFTKKQASCGELREREPVRDG